MNLGKLIFATALLAGALSAPLAHAALAKDIRDWNVTCTNGLTCTMSFADWNSKGIRSIEFRRLDAPNADIELMISAPPGFEEKGDSAGAYAIIVDGKTVLSLPVSAMRKQGYDVHMVYAEQKPVRALLDAMKAGSAMEIRYTGDLGAFSLPVKLSGVKGSLVYVDEAQDRLGRTDAMDAIGDKTPPEKTAARDLSALSQLPEGIRKDFGGEDSECGGLEDDISQFSGFELNSADRRMIVVPCGEGGAYNQPYALYLGTAKNMKMVPFPAMDGEGKPDPQNAVYNVDFDAKTNVFTSFFRGRGIGDCGLWSKWRLDKAKPVLILLEERRKDDCDGNDMGGPENFPLTFPAAK